MKSFWLLFALLSSVAFAESEPPPAVAPFDCELALNSGASFEEVQKRLSRIFRNGVGEFKAKPIRLVYANNIEMHIEFGTVGETEAHETYYFFEPYFAEESIAEARVNIPHNVVAVDAIRFSKDFKEMRLISLEQPQENLILRFKNPLNGWNLNAENVEYVRFESSDQFYLQHNWLMPQGPFKIMPERGIATKMKGALANEILSVMSGVHPYDESMHNYKPNGSGAPAQNGDQVDVAILMDAGRSTIVGIREVPDDDDFLGGQFSGKLIDGVNGEIEIEIIYRGGLLITVVNNEIMASLETFSQAETHFILRGLRALGLRKDHPIFDLADHGYFRN